MQNKLLIVLIHSWFLNLKILFCVKMLKFVQIIDKNCSNFFMLKKLLLKLLTILLNLKLF